MILSKSLCAGRALRSSNRVTPRFTVNYTPQPLRTLAQSSSVRLHLQQAKAPFTSSPRLAVSYSTTSQPDTIAPSSQQPSAPEKPDYLSESETEIWNRLVAEFEPAELVVQDISGGCGSMYGIEISSDKFRGSGMLKQQRMVNKVLADLMKDWHGVQLRTRVP